MAYDPELPACFGGRDLHLGVHPLDQDRLFQWLVSLREREVAWPDVRRQIEEFLTEVGAGEPIIGGAILRAERLIRPWLYGAGDDGQAG